MPRAKKKPETIEGLSASVAKLTKKLEGQQRLIDLLVYQGHNQGDQIARQERRIAELEQRLVESVRVVVEELVKPIQIQADITRQALERINSLEEWRLDHGDDD